MSSKSELPAKVKSLAECGVDGVKAFHDKGNEFVDYLSKHK